MPKAPSSQGRGVRPTGEHRPLAQDIREDEIVSRFGRVRAPTQRHRKKKQSDAESDDEAKAPGTSLKVTGGRAGKNYVDPKLSRNILRLAREQQEEIEREEAELEAEADVEPQPAFRDMDELEDDEDHEADEDASLASDDEDVYDDPDYAELGIDPEDQALLERHEEEEEQALADEDAGRPRTKTLADLIMAKIEAADETDGDRSMQTMDESRMMPPGINPKIIEVYGKVGELLSRYKSGPLPKAFKIIPSLPAWEDILYITNPEMWTPHATLAATRIFVSNFKPAQCERYYLSLIHI